jgi:hypothetical protein
MPRRSKSKLWIAVFVSIIVIIAIAVAANFNSQSKRKPKISEYLNVGHTKSTGTFYNQNKTLIIKELGLNITAIMGDAHNIIIIVASSEEPYIIDFLDKGNSALPSIQLRGYTTSLNETIGAFPLEIDISCQEAPAAPEDPPITIYLKTEDIVGISE